MAEGVPHQRVLLPGLPHPQASAQYFSLSNLDLACARWFFLVRQKALIGCHACRKARLACGAQTRGAVGVGKGPAGLAWLHAQCCPNLEAPCSVCLCTPQLLPQHDFFNVFLGGMLGGSIVWGLRAIINEPSAWGHARWLGRSPGAAALPRRLRIVVGCAYRRAWGVMQQPPAHGGC